MGGIRAFEGKAMTRMRGYLDAAMHMLGRRAERRRPPRLHHQVVFELEMALTAEPGGDLVLLTITPLEIHTFGSDTEDALANGLDALHSWMEAFDPQELEAELEARGANFTMSTVFVSEPRSPTWVQVDADDWDAPVHKARGELLAPA